MPNTYTCRKCGRNYSAKDFIESRFCRNCGTFLTPKVESPSNLSNKVASKSIRTDLEIKSTQVETKYRLADSEKTEPIQFANVPDINEYSELGLISYNDPYDIRKMIINGKFSSYEKFKLNLKAQEIKRIGAIDKLISMDVLRAKIDAHPYQMKVALTVLQEMNTNAILADEVGLGKTIEAGIIMKEFLVRGIVNTVLIIVPRSLLTQWKMEMREKFGENFVIANDRKEFVSFDSDDKIICSSGLLARRYKEVIRRKWDLVIVDEAHIYRNMKSKGRAILAALQKNYMLLLTATPLCNKLTDIYSLIDLLYPGRLGTERAFVSKYAEDTKCRVVRSGMVNELRSNIGEVMCRTRRIESGIPFTKRYVDSRRIEANNREFEFIEKATQYLKDVGNDRFKTIEQLKQQNPIRKLTEQQSRAILIFQAIAMQQSLSSSPYAAIETLQRRYNLYPNERETITELINLAKDIKSSKLELLEKVLNEVEKEQALIFCLRKATVRKIKEILNDKFGMAEIYIGDMTSHERDKIIGDFNLGKIRYLVATDAAAEGLNLQKCSVMFNYDLHWNPMKIEQRIGRIHRLGQQRDVTIFNLSIKDTIDDYVLHILYQKINLFAITVGGMETILSEIKEGGEDLQKTIMEIVLRSKTKMDWKKELEKLSQNVLYAKQKQELSRQFTEGVLG